MWRCGAKGRCRQGAREEDLKEKREAARTVPRCLATDKNGHPAQVAFHKVPSLEGEASAKKGGE